MVKRILVICWAIGPDIIISNSFINFSLYLILNFDIPPSGYRYILSTSIPNVFAIMKCPSSWNIISTDIIINGVNAPVSITIIINGYNNGLISNFLNIVFIG